MRPTLLLVSLSMMVVACGSSGESPVNPLRSPTEYELELQALPRPYLGVDVRNGSPSTCIPGVSLHIGLDRYDDLVACLGPDKSRPIALHCGGGGASAQVAAKLRAAGYTNVHELQGGINAWIGEGFATEACPGPSPVCDMPVP